MNQTEFEEKFGNFPAATRDAIRAYQATKDRSLVLPIVQGIMEKYLPEELRGQPLDPDKPLNTYGLESLTFVEVFLDIQDALEIAISEDELRQLKNFNEAIALISARVAELRADPESAKTEAL